MGRRRRVPLDLAAAGLALGWAAFAHRALPERARPAAGLAAAAGLTALARAAGAGWRDLGVDPRDARSGLRWGTGAALAVTAATAAARAADRRGTAFSDARVAAASPAEVAAHLLVRIPLATALAEELVFRGVILGLATRARRPRDALVLSALTFGLWHVGAALHPARRHATAGVVGDRLAPAPAVVAGDVVATAIAGLGFGWLRLRSHSIVAPTMAHAAVNASAYVATRFGSRSGPVPGE
jgi:membrane protease YdiL (CAAX protease family)